MHFIKQIQWFYVASHIHHVLLNYGYMTIKQGSAVYPDTNKLNFFLFSNFRHVLNVVLFLLGDSPSSEFYMPTFRNTLFHRHRRCKQEE